MYSNDTDNATRSHGTEVLVHPQIQCEIRSARLEDYEALCRLYTELDETNRKLLPDVFRAVEGPVRTVETIREKLSDRRAIIFVAEVAGEVVGLVDVQSYDQQPFATFQPRVYAYIESFVVSPEFRGAGVADALFRRLEAWALEHGIPKIQLTAYNANRGAMGKS